ncbi:MAG: EAL domain-containing protein, partial [Thiothrix sp.]|nr:EAL domain-containing protein [Thiothrix sp.]
GQSPQVMFNAADAALYAVKEQGRGRFLFFDDVYSHNAEVMLALERDLHVAVQQRQFTVYYQPIVCMNDGRTIGLEALVRWQRPEFGLLLPAAWIDSAERLAKLSSITCQVIEQVAQDCRHWHRQGLNPGLLHLNITEGMLVSGMTLQFLSRTFAQAFQGEEGRPGMPQQLSVEVTESVLIDRSFTVLKQQLQQLRAAGIQVALDDFGSGFATLAHLNSIPFDTLKLDHRFTGKLLEDEGTQVIVRALIFMAAGLNKTLIFEGVSNPMLHDALLAMGARYAQGFFYSKPLPAGGVSAWLEGQTAQQEYSKHDC